jgi:subtilase family serine protease
MRRKAIKPILVPLESRSLLSASMTGVTPAMPSSAIAVSSWMKYYGFAKLLFASPQGTTVRADGRGETIAIVVWNRDASYVNSDSPDWANSGLARYSVARGLPTSGFKFSMVNQNGDSSSLPAPSDQNAEFVLDTQTVHTAAPYANIVVVVANSGESSDLDAAIKTAISLHPAVVSMSFGSQETSSSSSSASDFAPDNGVTYLAAAGDHGAGMQFGTGSAQTGTPISFHRMSSPADEPMVVQVGGTRLKVSSAGQVTSEIAWGKGRVSDQKGGSGGGYSHFVARPLYQVSSPYIKRFLARSGTPKAVLQHKTRLGPDVSMMSMPGLTTLRYSSTTGFYWFKNDGGTSLATPMFASVISIADQGRALAGKKPLSSLRTLQLLYHAPASVYHDVTKGSNGFPAGPGFDLATGLGSVKVANLVRYLVTSA